MPGLHPPQRVPLASEPITSAGAGGALYVVRRLDTGVAVGYLREQGGGKWASYRIALAGDGRETNPPRPGECLGHRLTHDEALLRVRRLL